MQRSMTSSCQSTLQGTLARLMHIPPCPTMCCLQDMRPDLFVELMDLWLGPMPASAE